MREMPDIRQHKLGHVQQLCLVLVGEFLELGIAERYRNIIQRKRLAFDLIAFHSGAFPLQQIEVYTPARCPVVQGFFYSAFG